MEEITLTGGTLAASSGGGSGGGSSNGVAASGHKGHEHHGGGSGGGGSLVHGSQKKSCCHNHGKEVAVEMPTMDMSSIQELVDSPKEEVCRALSTLLRFGRFEAVAPVIKLLEEKKGKEGVGEVIQLSDDGGHSLMHWAAKRVDDIRFLQTLVDYLVALRLTNLLNVASKDNVGMRPFHWACTEGSIPHIALLLKYGADLEAKDSSGCTPLLIAAQYGQVEVVAYLLKKGANLQAVDSSWDTALHWAAYKGSIQVCGLLSFHEQLTWTTQDAYGQTPLHLASLRGHTSVVRYILLHLKSKDILFLKDKNERTPLDLAIHKNRPTVEAVLREAMAAVEDPRGHFFRKTVLSTLKDIVSIKAWKSWMGLTTGMDEMDGPVKFPFYYVVFNLAVHFYFMIMVFAPFTSAGAGLLWDQTGWLFCNFGFMFASWYFFYKTVTTQPGFVDDSLPTIAKWRKLYEDTLEAYADEDRAGKIDTPLCHTCHIAKPLRSKHCRVTGKCVLLFDHYCPFVSNTIGLYNYRYFYLFLMFLSLGVLSFIWTFITYMHRYTRTHSMPWFTLIMGLDVAICALPICGMWLYHTQLSMVNLTTNEHINMRKYKHFFPLINGKRQYKNPWFKGWWGNFMDRMFPTERSYLISSEHQSLIDNNSDNTHQNDKKNEIV